MSPLITDLLTGVGENTLAYAVILLVLGILGQLVINGKKYGNDRKLAAISADEVLQRHNSEISIQLLEQLRLELSRLAEENARLSPYVERARDLARHLDSILHASDESSRSSAEDSAKLYLYELRALELHET